MRIPPRPLIGVLAVVVYATIMALCWAATGADYATIPDTTGQLLSGVVVTVGAAVLFAAVLTTWLGWWGPALREERTFAPRWALIVPVLMALVALTNVVSIDYGAKDLSWVATLALGVAFVGFGEELTTRGLALVGFRGSLSEMASWLLSSVLFALLHSINALFGQSLVVTADQMVFAFLLGSALYVVRMSTGTLVVAMVLHAVWDFGALGMSGSGAGATVISVIGNLLSTALMLVGLIAAVVVARRVDRERARQPLEQSAA